MLSIDCVHRGKVVHVFEKHRGLGDRGQARATGYESDCTCDALARRIIDKATQDYDAPLSQGERARALRLQRAKDAL